MRTCSIPFWVLLMTMSQVMVGCDDGPFELSDHAVTERMDGTVEEALADDLLNPAASAQWAAQPDGERLKARLHPRTTEVLDPTGQYRRWF